MIQSIKTKRGFVLPTTLFLMLLISSLSVGLFLVTKTEGRVAGTDMENTQTYYGAEAAMEKMVVDVNRLYTQHLSPTIAQIQALSSTPPDLGPDVHYSEYEIDVDDDGSGSPSFQTRLIGGGPYEGMNAHILPLDLRATAQTRFGNEVRMERRVEVALIPVFQFGIFSETDLSYFPGPNFDFGGRVHTNENLFLATSADLTFRSRITAAEEIIRAELSNGLSTIDTGRTGPVNVPTGPAGCDGAAPACRDLDENEGSKVAGPGSAENTAWEGLSTTTYNGMILNGSTGARKLELPFVTEGAMPVELIRRPPDGENGSSLLSQARLHNQAQIRVLLADDPSQLPDSSLYLANGGLYDLPPPPGWQAVCHNPGPEEHTLLVNDTSLPTHLGHGDTLGACPNPGGSIPTIAATTAFAEADPVGDTDFVPPPGVSTGETWPLIGGYLLVQARQSSGWANVTAEWLEQGIARENPDAILKFQTYKDPNDPLNVLNDPFKFIPLNLYDTREGEVRDNSLGDGNSDCAVGGIMNVVELDVNNLRRWLTGALGSTGSSVESVSQNGYIFYFSDRRGMLPGPIWDPEATPADDDAEAAAFLSSVNGTYGFEDVVNPLDANGVPDGVMDEAEDVNENGSLENYGADNLGEGFGVPNGDPTARVDCFTIGKKNRVSGARRAIKLTNGSLGSLPTKPDGTGGFTVASENPVYVHGNYNADAAGFVDPHASAAVIADAVTLLSNNWQDWNRLEDPTYVGSSTLRTGTETWYRVAIAAGKNRSFPHPSWTTAQDYGLDGGTHNFLRYLENWGGQTLHYRGSLVSLYYSQYAVGIYKCCETVYTPPTRDYGFDSDFTFPDKLPPGTPRFRDIVNLHFRQILSPD